MSMREATRRKRDRVVETALQMFAEHGFEHVSVEDIIRETGISKGTFYHYFSGKDEIVLVLAEEQRAIIDAWSAKGPTVIKSLEGHVNRLFLDLAHHLAPYRALVRSLFALTAQQPRIRRGQRKLFAGLYRALLRWLPDAGKAELAVSVYVGALLVWSLDERLELESLVRRRLSGLWDGLRHSGPESPLVVEPRHGQKVRVAVIGGGLAGLTAASYLSASPHVTGVLYERSPQLGGRAFAYERAGFTLNYGAHAIYGIDRHAISRVERELGLSFASKMVDKRKVMYAKNGRMTEAPLDFVNLLRTDLLNRRQKVRFAGEIAAIVTQIHHLRKYDTLGDYLAESGADEEVKELWEHLVCSNFFIPPEDARKVPGPVISDYYQNLFVSGKPVNYILGSWAVITNQLRQKIEQSGRFAIRMKQGVEAIRYEEGKYILATREGEEAFDRVVFAMPVQQVVKLLSGTPWEPFLAPYASGTPTEVMVYDVGLKRVVARPFSYISDMDRKMFITDVSATDQTLIPGQGQLLQGVAYLQSDGFFDETARKTYLDERLADMEDMFDRYYPGWREATEVKRISKRAMVQSVKHVAGNRMLPVQLDQVPFYFCGDGCDGKGELAERAFSSAREAARLLLHELERSASGE